MKAREAVGLARISTNNLRKVSDIKRASENAQILLAQQTKSAAELLEIGLSLCEDGEDFSSPIPYCEEALKLTDDPVILAECYYVIAVASNQGKKDLAASFKYHNLALATAEKVKESNPHEYARLVSNIHRNMGINYLPGNDNAAAEVHFKTSIDVAKQSPELLEGFIPAVTAYYALVLCKQGKYEEGFAQFKEAEKLYKAFPGAELAESMDYASYFVHMGRILLQQKKFEEAVKPLERGLELRNQTLRLKHPDKSHDYIESRVGAVQSLLQQARLGVQEAQKPMHNNTKILAQAGSPFHHVASDGSAVESIMVRKQGFK